MVPGFKLSSVKKATLPVPSITQDTNLYLINVNLEG